MSKKWNMTPLWNREGEFALPEDGFFHIVPKGEYPHRRTGLVQVLDDAAMQAMANRFNEEASDPNFPGLLIDYDHFSNDSDKSTEAAGWLIAIENRNDGLWGKIKWSDSGEEAVSGGRFRFVSPVWNLEESDRMENKRIRPKRLDQVALTNDHNLKGLTPLSNRSDGGSSGGNNKNGNPHKSMEQHTKMLLTLLGLSEGASDDAIQNRFNEVRPELMTNRQTISGLEAERDSLKKDKDALENRVGTLEKSNETMLKSAVETDLEKYADVIKDKDAMRATLIENREGTLKILDGLKLDSKSGGQENNNGGTHTPMHNRDQEASKGTPGSGGEQGRTSMAQLSEAETTKITNRANELVKTLNIGFRDAFDRAKAEHVPAS